MYVYIYIYIYIYIRTYNAFAFTVCLVGRYEDIYIYIHTHIQHELLSRYRGYASDKWVPVTTARYSLLLRMEERPPIWKVAAKILNKQSRTADKG